MRAFVLAGVLALWSGAASAAEFVFTGGFQTFIVGDGGFYDIAATGAAGGATGAAQPDQVGRGAVIGGRVFLEAGTVLDILVGGAGLNGGGGGGGGGTFVFFGGSPFGSANALIVAGGGGGAGFLTSGGNATGAAIGTSGAGGGGGADGGGGGGGGVDASGTGGSGIAFGLGASSNGGNGGKRPGEGGNGGDGGSGVLAFLSGGDGGFGGGGGASSLTSIGGGGGGGGGFGGGKGGDSGSGGGAGTSFIVASAIGRVGGTAATLGDGRFAITLSLPDGPAPAIPEPASWITMIVGFGIVGSVMRRRRRASATYA